VATTKLHSEAILENLLARSEVPALVELAKGRGAVRPSDNVSEPLKGRDAPPKPAWRDTLLAASLADAYMAYWTLAEWEPLEKFGMVYRHIVRLEAETEAQVAWQALRETATAYHRRIGVCPFCKRRGPLHLPAEQFTMELSHGS